MTPNVNVIINGAHGRDFVYKTVVLKDNLGFAEQVTEENCKYIVRWKYNLGGEVITMPANCILDFEGGSVENGRIESNGTVLKGVCKNSSDCLFGVFYDENGNILGWDKNKIEDWKVSTEFGNLTASVEPGVTFGGNQSMAMDENYLYLMFVQNYTSNNQTLGRVTVVMYDRNYNYIGYTELSRPSHANGATIYNNKLYISCSSGYLGTDSIHIIDTTTLLQNCSGNKGRLRSEATITDVTVLNLGYEVTSLDYDGITNTFALGFGNPAYYICDTEFNILKESAIGDYRDFGEAKFGRRTTTQDFAYQNGVLFIIDYDYNYPNSDAPGGASVLYTVDVATDRVLSVQPIHFDLYINESEGVCKDPVTGNIYVSSTNYGSYSNDAFSVCALYYSNKQVENDSRQSLQNRHWINTGNGGVVYINNSYTGVSCGSYQYPYKTLGEAFVMAGDVSNRMDFRLFYTGVPYYVENFGLSDAALRMYGQTLGPNGEKPEVDGTFTLRNVVANIDRLQFNPSSKHVSTYSGILNLNQHSNIVILNCNFLNQEGSKCSRSIYAERHVYLQIEGGRFSDTRTGEDVSHILLSNYGSSVKIVSATIDNGILINPGNASNEVMFWNLNNITLAEDSLIIYSDSRTPMQHKIGMSIFTDEQFEKVKSLFTSTDGTKKLQSFALSFYLSKTFTDEEGNALIPGWYTNDIIDDTYIFTRSLDNADRLDGTQACASFETLPLIGGNSGRMIYSNGEKKPMWWDGSKWLDADGLPTDSPQWHSDNENLIKGSNYPVLRSNYALRTPIDSTWRVTNLDDQNPANVVDVSFDWLPDVKKGIKLTAGTDERSEVAYEVPFAAGKYTVSCWVSGTGTLTIHMGNDISSLYKSFDIDSNDKVFVFATFNLTDQYFPNLSTSVYIRAEENSDFTICAMKCEKGDKPTLWKVESPHGTAAGRPTQMSVGSQYFDTTINKMLYWNGYSWTVVGEGKPAENLLKRCRNLRLFNNQHHSEGYWRQSSSSEVTATLGSLSDGEVPVDVKNYINMPTATLSEVGIPLYGIENGTYTFSAFFKGNGTVGIYAGYSEHYTQAVTKEIHSTDYTHVVFTFVLPTSSITTEYGADKTTLFLCVQNGDMKFCAPKLEKGGTYTGWSVNKEEEGLLNLKILGFGDSICRAWRNSQKGYLYYLSDDYKNIAESGATISTKITSVKNIMQQLVDEATDNTYHPDVLLAEGGINDYLQNATLGDVSTSALNSDVDAESLDKSTLCGAVQYLCYKMCTLYPNARRFFLLIHRTSNKPWTENTKGYTQQKAFDAIREICQLYSVKVIDIYNESFINTRFEEYLSPVTIPTDGASDAEGYYVNDDGLHPLDKGYKEGYAPLIRTAIKAAFL